MFETLKRLLTPTVGLLCPRCEKPLEGHDQAACDRRMSRRYFFGCVAGGAASVANAPAIVKAVTDLVMPSGYAERIAVHAGNRYLTTDMVAEEMLNLLNHHLAQVRMVTNTYDRQFGLSEKIGDTIQIRKPPQFRMPVTLA